MAGDGAKRPCCCGSPPASGRDVGVEMWLAAKMARGEGTDDSETNKKSTKPGRFSIGPENGWLEDEFPFGKAYFQGLC